MISHILVPLDGSALAECVLPHVLAIASPSRARITLLHVLEPPHTKENEHTIDPLEWHLKKREAGIYLEEITHQLKQANLRVGNVVLEGVPADCVIDYANSHDVALIALSSHGRGGLSGWNISSVVQKIILRSFKSTFLVRAYKSIPTEITPPRYQRLFVGLDSSARAEYILPLAISLAQFHKAKLILGMVLRKPELLDRFPISDDDAKLVAQIVERNHHVASHYFETLRTQLSMQGVDAKTLLSTSDNVTAALHDMVEQQDADLVMLVAHGHSGEGRWPYGSIATSFIAYGATSLMIVQDLPAGEIGKTMAEAAAHEESKGH